MQGRSAGAVGPDARRRRTREARGWRDARNGVPMAVVGLGRGPGACGSGKRNPDAPAAQSRSRGGPRTFGAGLSIGPVWGSGAVACEACSSSVMLEYSPIGALHAAGEVFWRVGGADHCPDRFVEIKRARTVLRHVVVVVVGVVVSGRCLLACSRAARGGAARTRVGRARGRIVGRRRGRARARRGVGG